MEGHLQSQMVCALNSSLSS